MQNIYMDVITGRSIWIGLREKYELVNDEMLIFVEIDESELIKKVNEILFEQVSQKIYVITCMEKCSIQNAITIRLTDEDYQKLRLYYLVTVFHPRVRFITDREPFGNLNLYWDGNVDQKEYIKRGILKL